MNLPSVCRLAETGLEGPLTAFLAAAGPTIDILRRTRDGATALQLARICQHTAAAEVLQPLTELAARSAGDALLQVRAKMSVINDGSIGCWASEGSEANKHCLDGCNLAPSILS